MTMKRNPTMKSFERGKESKRKLQVLSHLRGNQAVLFLPLPFNPAAKEIPAAPKPYISMMNHHKILLIRMMKAILPPKILLSRILMMMTLWRDVEVTYFDCLLFYDLTQASRCYGR